MIRWVVASADYSVGQGQKEKQLLHGMLQKKEHFKKSGQILLRDIKETRDKVKERMEEIIEVSSQSSHHFHRNTVCSLAGSK
jgi:hypothetical protein